VSRCARVACRLVAVLLVALSAPLLSAGPAAACSCSMTDAADMTRDDVLASDAVFVGEVVSRREWSVTATYVFRVERVHAGDVRRMQAVRTSSDGGSCGLEIPDFGRFLVSASRDPGNGQLWSDLCGGAESMEPDERGAVLASKLGAGREPSPGESPGVPDPRKAALISGSVLIAAVAGAYAWARRRVTYR
jgi:hypothetical protein